MKFTITRINKQNKLMVSSKTVERFLERIAKDDAKLSVTNFRMSVPLMESDYQYYKGIKEWQHVYPAAEFNKDESGNLVFQKSNGLVMLHFINLMSDQEKDAVKKTVSLLPMTFAAFEGADGRSLIVLVSICNEEGKIPTKEADADLLYQSAYEQVKTLYQSQVQATIKAEKPSLASNFMLIITAKPKAHAFKNEMCFPLTKTKCELKKHPNSKFECFFNDFNRTKTSLFLPFPSKLIQDNLVCVLELQE